MGVLDTTYTFTATDVVTSAKLNNVIDQTTFTATAITGTTLALLSGQLKVNAQGITPMEVASGDYAINVTGSSASCTGNAATATNVAYTGLTGTVPTWNQNTAGSSASCTGNAATATNSNLLNSQNSSFYTNIPARLGFTPVQQGGGNLQYGNKIYIGWSAASNLRLQVDSTDFGSNFPISISGNASSSSYATRAENGPVNGTFSCDHSANNSRIVVAGFSPNSQGNGIYFNAAASTAAACLFDLNGTNKGAINITANGVNFFSQSSDYRLKTDYLPIENAVNRIDSLNPVNFKWIEDGTRDEGFIAHELQDVVPSAVSGEKDEVDSDNNPVMQKIDRTHLIPLLTAAIQELSARVKALEAAAI